MANEAWKETRERGPFLSSSMTRSFTFRISDSDIGDATEVHTVCLLRARFTIGSLC